jgi:hypothetical protein
MRRLIPTPRFPEISMSKREAAARHDLGWLSSPKLQQKDSESGELRLPTKSKRFLAQFAPCTAPFPLPRRHSLLLF